jgi:hypothetical protein
MTTTEINTNKEFVTVEHDIKRTFNVGRAGRGSELHIIYTMEFKKNDGQLHKTGLHTTCGSDAFNARAHANGNYSFSDITCTKCRKKAIKMGLITA